MIELLFILCLCLPVTLVAVGIACYGVPSERPPPDAAPGRDSHLDQTTVH